MSFADLWRELEPLGRDPGTGGYRRYSWTPADTQGRAWFTRQAENLGLAVEADNNGNLWAWWAPKKPKEPAENERHRDRQPSGLVPDGGGYDGALGVVSALAAVEMLKDKDFYPERPVVLALFTEEEGARFRVPCLGSRLITGAIDPETARALTDDDGDTLAAAMTAAGCDASLLGPRPDLLDGMAAFVELHVEQGRALAPMGAALGLAEGIWPHGRWRLDFQGRADHAGTARLADRKDPMLPYARTVLAARHAAACNGALATFGKVIAEPAKQMTPKFFIVIVYFVELIVVRSEPEEPPDLEFASNRIICLLCRAASNRNMSNKIWTMVNIVCGSLRSLWAPSSSSSSAPAASPSISYCRITR